MRCLSIAALLVGQQVVSAGAETSPLILGYQAQREKVGRIMAAVVHQDAAAIRKEGAVGVPYFVGHDQSRAKSTPFNVKLMAQFAKCKPSRPSMTGINWLTVQWDCPKDVTMPWPSTATAVKLNSLEVVEIRTVPGAAMIISIS